VIRERTDDDLEACAALAAEVHAVDGYPSFLGDGTFRSFIAPDDALGAWVSTLDGAIVGNVVLRPRSAPGSVVLAAQELGCAPEQLGFVSRLLVAPAARRRGLARQLLDRVVDEARARRLRTVLDVVTRDVSAIALYDASSWVRLGGHTMTLRSGSSLEVVVYAAP
jgi:ribosomal protein S18 acetylase RimI-like enzyme